MQKKNNQKESKCDRLIHKKNKIMMMNYIHEYFLCMKTKNNQINHTAFPFQ